MTGSIPHLGCLSGGISLVEKCIAREMVVTIVAIIVNVFPRPISSARIPPNTSSGA